MDPLDPEADFVPKANAASRKSRGHRDRPADIEAHSEDLTQHDYSVRAPELVPPPQPIWTEHRDPSGRLYYHNPVTKESRWDHNPNPPASGAPVHQQPQPQAVRAPPVAAAERALAMKKIPTTAWAIVLTNTEKEFFYNLTTKESMWDMPDDLGDLVGQLIAEAMGVDINDEFNDDDMQSEFAGGSDHDGANEEGDQEVERESGGVQADEQAVGSKRKAPADEEEDDREADSKRMKSGPAEATSEPPVAEKQATPAVGNMEEKTAEFMALLREADVSPYTTWEKELPKIIDDRRYAQLPTLKDRKAIFDQYCVIRVAELREAAKNKKTVTPKEAYQQLLKDETTQRTRWDEFSRKFKRDKRFSNMPQRGREPAFRAHIAELKKPQTRSAKDDFIALLKETRDLHADSSWRRVQQDIDRDPRYRAVRSSSEREELFRAHVKTLRRDEPSQRETKDDAQKREADRKAREAAALRERQAAIRQDQAYLNREMSSHRHSLQTQDATVVFQAMLLDTVRSADAEWVDMRPYLERDANWARCSAALDQTHMQRLFAAHTAQLHEKRVAAFAAALLQTTDLTTTWDDVRPWILNDPRAKKLVPPPPTDGDDDEDAYRARLTQAVQAEFEQFQTRRLREARSGLVELLEENNFLKFYVKNAVGEARATAIENKSEPIEGSEWGWIKLEEIAKVLSEDKRFIQLQSFAGERDQKLKEHVRDLILRYRAEKGGTVDRTLALASSTS
ncbi:transcription elongation regulator [Geranomyces variabilis]|uniref:Transcription elongation regulator n=1 Tax=Geranomyces variabilis TaxID=109894 RepID=A0AAD5XQM6_9FUNG|nr:transcription elongation regulator [Geranomyces variabilis]